MIIWSSTSTFPVSSKCNPVNCHCCPRKIYIFVIVLCPTLLMVFAARLPTSASSDSATEYGRITFEFETLCTADCVMYFMMVSTASRVHFPLFIIKHRYSLRVTCGFYFRMSTGRVRPLWNHGEKHKLGRPTRTLWPKMLLLPTPGLSRGQASLMMWV